MRATFYAGIAAIALGAHPALAEEAAMAASAPAAKAAAPAAAATAEKARPRTTRQETIRRLEERVAELKKMTDEEWNKMQEVRGKRRGHRQHHRQADPAPKAATPSQPAAPAKTQ